MPFLLSLLFLLPLLLFSLFVWYLGIKTQDRWFKSFFYTLPTYLFIYKIKAIPQSVCVGEKHSKIVSLYLTWQNIGFTFAFCAFLPSAGCCCALQSAAAALQAEQQDPDAHWPWQDCPSMEPSSHSALMVAALSWSRFSSSPDFKKRGIDLLDF